jgi:hypothetical protein
VVDRKRLGLTLPLQVSGCRTRILLLVVKLLLQLLLWDL